MLSARVVPVADLRDTLEPSHAVQGGSPPEGDVSAVILVRCPSLPGEIGFINRDTGWVATEWPELAGHLRHWRLKDRDEARGHLIRTEEQACAPEQGW